MKLRVNVKSMGKKPKAVTETICTIAGRPKTVKELILAVVDSQVEEYNQRVEASKGQLEAYPKVLSCLTKEFIDQQAEGGRISFGINYGDRKADLKTARENGIQCFEDGIYRIFMDGQPLEALEDTVEITEEHVFKFVLLTMLAGRMW